MSGVRAGTGAGRDGQSGVSANSEYQEIKLQEVGPSWEILRNYLNLLDNDY